MSDGPSVLAAYLPLAGKLARVAGTGDAWSWTAPTFPAWVNVDGAVIGAMDIRRLAGDEAHDIPATGPSRPRWRALLPPSSSFHGAHGGLGSDASCPDGGRGGLGQLPHRWTRGAVNPAWSHREEAGGDSFHGAMLTARNIPSTEPRPVRSFSSWR